MADFNILNSVKSSLGITGEYQDDTLNQYIAEVKEYLIDAGVPEIVVNSLKSAGVISRGVNDLWTYGAGKLSEYFTQRVTQLVYSIESGKIISFSAGDYGISYPVNIEGFEIEDTDVITFRCGEVVKTYTNEIDNCLLITFTKDESESLSPGTYNWTLKLSRDDALVTLINDGLLIVG